MDRKENDQEVLLEFSDFGFHYQAQAEPTLYGINLTLRKGEKILIAGPSGCGKSTLANCINGLIPFSYRGKMTGSCRIRGKETSKMNLFEISQTVGTVLQDSDGQFIGLTVAEDIAFALENDCVEDPQLHERVKKTADIVGIGDHLTHAPGAVSGGQKQRVALGGVMVSHVDLLLFDEPLANLDPATGKTAIELIDEICRLSGAGVVIIEHRLEDVLHQDVDRIILMNDGRIIADMKPGELLCTDLLVRSGIREPLYLTALRYAGVKVTPEMHPESIRILSISAADREKVRKWYGKAAPVPENPNCPVMLETRNLSFAYDNGCVALKEVSVDIREGEMLAIVGTNGAGKSTFSKVVCGFEKSSGGTVRFRGSEDWMNLSIKERAEHIGYVMQNPNQMISQVMIFDEVALGLRKRGHDEESVRRKVEETLKVCGLWEFRNWPVSALSYGQKKRVTIAAILVLEPEMIILDEPTAGQDFRHYTVIMEFLKMLGEKGYTVVMITHDMHLMLEYAPRSVVFNSGEIIADGSSAGILTDPLIVRQANLKETSLYDLALMCGIDDAEAFARHFIDYERREVRQ